MLKLIYRHLMANSKRYCWIFIELCLVTVIGWNVLDEVIVNEYYNSLPLGYDLDRLVTFELAQVPSEGEESVPPEEQQKDINRILAKVRDNKYVEAATIGFSNYSYLSSSLNCSLLPSSNPEEDFRYIHVWFWMGTDFFKTFGLKDVLSSDDKTFEEPPLKPNDVIISKSIADYLFPAVSPLGHALEENDTVPAKEYTRIMGVVNEISYYRPDWGRSPIVYYAANPEWIGTQSYSVDNINLTVRLKPGVDTEKFVRDHTSFVNNDLKSGSIYAHSLQSYESIKKSKWLDANRKNFIKTSIALFFFFNIILCMVSTFYLQTRKRTNEIGVMRSFGASKRFVLCEMLGEGVIMTVLSWLLGCLAYWFYIRDKGLYHLESWGEESMSIKQVIPMWYDNFNTHFLVVSLIILLLMLISVLIGIYIPARRISRINPVDALRDE